MPLTTLFREGWRQGAAVPDECLVSHPSKALAEMAEHLSTLERPNLLDLGPLCDKNIEYFGSRGCRVFVEAAEDLRRLPREPLAVDLDETPGSEPPKPRIRLAYPDDHFDGVLLWDVVDYLTDEICGELTGELDRVSRDGAMVALFSDARAKPSAKPLLRYRVSADGMLTIEPMPGPPVERVGRVNRDFFRLFPGCEVAKSTILRNQLREVLLRKSS